jgi:hypothetical protein
MDSYTLRMVLSSLLDCESKIAFIPIHSLLQRLCDSCAMSYVKPARLITARHKRVPEDRTHELEIHSDSYRSRTMMRRDRCPIGRESADVLLSWMPERRSVRSSGRRQPCNLITSPPKSIYRWALKRSPFATFWWHTMRDCRPEPGGEETSAGRKSLDASF